MPLLENKFLCNHLVIPKIVMSTYSKTESPPPEEPAYTLQLNDLQECGVYANSPEIRCSPSPCVFDHPSPNRTPSPDSDCSPRFRRRSLRRSASPGSRRGSEVAPGYEQYQKSLLEVPTSTEYGDASSDDLSSEWDSDVGDVPHAEQAKVSIFR